MAPFEKSKSWFSTASGADPTLRGAMRWKSLLPVAVVAAVLGCAAAVGIVTTLDLGGGHTTTVVQQAPLRGEDASGGGAAGLTPRDIYKRAAPGVVFIRAQVVEQTQSPFDFGFPQQQ